MTPRLQKLLDKLRKPKGDTQTTTEVQEIPVEESPALIIVPAWDYPTEDEFSPYF